MRILAVHNYYQQPGGEEQIFNTEATLLQSYGHEVVRYTLNNDQISGISSPLLAKNALWNGDVYKELRSIIRQKQPQIAHFHNTFPLISPAAYYAAKDEGVAVVQTLHNYRLLCPNALFFRDGKVCEDCLGKPFPLPGIIHGCYRGSRSASAMVASTVGFHSLIGTWSKAVDTFIAYSKFAMNKFIEGGLPAEKFAFKTNFLHPAPEPGEGKGGYGLFVGRLSVEKGLGVMLDAWRQLENKIPLKILGDGPMSGLVKDAMEEMPEIEWLGRKPLEEVYEILGDAAFLVFPSEWYETFGRVAIEAFAKGTPVVASKIGAITELVDHKRTGMHFKASDSSDLAAQIEWLLEHPQELQGMRQEARIEFEKNFTAKDNYQRLIEIYSSLQST
ncbi:glycosyltransferase family 4 protein [Nodosilinea sp. LEGE 07088]|uniref:glycosyltransferase family 4 protein n=1 Tax=Nodosilinea sp. LEGE 07088 TaxID=2777968 RepID=UPI001882DE51|nr:glycosyltransferase family 4 protein [Nodosilinea sp. LEGE 07088]MBE9140099.1 glycosyltransferase family 4 protein [Nodosilinea sp. LEGE 07088]